MGWDFLRTWVLGRCLKNNSFFLFRHTSLSWCDSYPAANFRVKAVAKYFVLCHHHHHQRYYLLVWLRLLNLIHNILARPATRNLPQSAAYLRLRQHFHWRSLGARRAARPEATSSGWCATIIQIWSCMKLATIGFAQCRCSQFTTHTQLHSVQMNSWIVWSGFA